MNWIARARHEMRQRPSRPAANAAETPLSAATAAAFTRERDPQTGWTVLWVSDPETLEARPELLEGEAPIFYTLERERLCALSPARRLAEYRRRLEAQRHDRRARP